MVIAEEEMKKCKDTAGFIAFIYWREAVFGEIVALVGPVSYTHLDVYKRQDKEWFTMGRIRTGEGSFGKSDESI